jgi:hypothetical protein
MVEALGVELRRCVENRQATDFADLRLPSLQSLLAILDQFGSMAKPPGAGSFDNGAVHVLGETADKPALDD